jgi:hypothetical protein
MRWPVAGGSAVYNESTSNPKLFILGGYSDSLQSAVDWIQEYDILSNQWKIVGNMKARRNYFVARRWNNKIIYFGGTSSTSPHYSHMESWDMSLQTEPVVIDSNKNFERSYVTGHISGDNLYIIGGTSQQAQTGLAYILGYNLSIRSEFFSYVLQTNENPEQHMTIFLGDFIYIYGGYFNGVKSWIKRFSISKNQLENLTSTILEPRAGGVSIYNSRLGKGFIIAGRNEIKSAIKSVEQILFYPNGTFLISSTSPINTERRNPMAVNYGNTIMLLGGFDENNKVVSSVEILIDPNDIDEDILPSEYSLFQNYPNPFNPTTNINYSIPVAGYVSLKVFDLLGREVATLVNEYKQPGIYNSKFSILNLPAGRQGSQFASGVYIYILKAGNFVQVRKMVLMK